MTDSPRIEDLRRRVQQDPASIIFAALAEEYRRTGRFEEAIATCTAGLKRHPSYLSARVTLGRALLGAGRPDDARLELEAVLRAAPENLAAIRALAELHQQAAAIAESTPATGGPRATSPVPVYRDHPAPDEARLRALESFLDGVRLARRRMVGSTG